MKFIELIEVREVSKGKYGKRRFSLNQDMIKTMYDPTDEWSKWGVNTTIFIVGSSEPHHVLETMGWISEMADLPQHVVIDDYPRSSVIPR